MKNYHMVYDNQNEEIGFYDENNVVHFGDDEIQPVKAYTYIPDEKEDKSKEGGSGNKQRPIIKPEDLLHGNTKNNNNVSEVQSDTITSAKIIQILLLIFVVLVALVLVVFGVYM